MRTNERSYTERKNVHVAVPLHTKLMNAFLRFDKVELKGEIYLVVDHARIKGTEATMFFLRKMKGAEDA